MLALVRKGVTSRAIAAELGIASSTVDSHVKEAMRKLGARTRRHAVLLFFGGERQG